MVRAPQTIPAAELDTAWTRPPHDNIIRINSPEMLAEGPVKHRVAEWMEKSNMGPDEWKLEPIGDSPSKSYVLQILGHLPGAAKKARQALDALRMANGQWERLDVKTPGGATTQLYAQLDKSQQQNKVEALLRKASRAGRERHPGMQWRLLRSDGVLTANWKKVAKVSCPTREEVRIEFNRAALEQLGVEEDLLREAINGDGASTEEVRWSS